MPGRTRDLTACSAPELLDLFISVSGEIETVDHIGRVNRLHATRRRIVAAIKDRTDGTTRALLPLLAHQDPQIRQTAAFFYGEVDPEAYLGVLRELALRKDKVGRDAASSLEWRKTHPFSGPATVPEHIPSPRDSRLSGHSAPAGMSREELEPLLFDAFPRDIATALLKLARPAIRVWPQPLSSTAPIASSRLGGLPAVCEQWTWPTINVWPKSVGLDWLEKLPENRGMFPQEPLWFLGQINLADIADFAASSLVPATGLFSFFADSDLATGCDGSSNNGALYYFSPEQALHYAEELVEDFEILPSCGLAFSEAVDLPDPFSTAIKSLALDKPLHNRYFDLRTTVNDYGVKADRYGTLDHSKLFGWPDLVQHDLEVFSRKRPGDERLLLQLGNYDNGKQSWWWGPGGLVYFAMSEAALYKGELTEGCCEMQCT